MDEKVLFLQETFDLNSLKIISTTIKLKQFDA